MSASESPEGELIGTMVYPTEEEIAVADVLEEPTYITYQSPYPIQYLRITLTLGPEVKPAE